MSTLENPALALMKNPKIPVETTEFFELFCALTFAKDGDSRGNNALIGGFWLWPYLPCFWPQIKHFPVDGDVLIATFPKCGTTWMQHMAYLIVTEDFEGANKVEVDVRAPFIEYPKPPSNATLDELAKRPKPRLMKTHLPGHLLPDKMAENGKVIYVYRNPKDACVSYYHHMIAYRRAGIVYEKPFEEFARSFMKGDVGYGPFDKHYQSYHKLSKQPGADKWLLMVRYEDLKLETRREIRRIAKFLNRDLSDETVERIYEATKFETMQSNDACNYSWLEKAGVFQGRFVRKGVVGDWANYFTDKKLFDDFEAWIEANIPAEMIFKTE